MPAPDRNKNDNIRRRPAILPLLTALCVLLAAPFCVAEENGENYSPYADEPPVSRLLWGDTHLHTSASTDAAARGNTLNAEQAYRFARGETVSSSTGLRARLSRPLDFLVVADHSDGMGFFDLLKAGSPAVMNEALGRRWHQLLKEGRGLEVSREVVGTFAQGKMPWKTNDPELRAPVWDANLAAAEAFNEPGVFSALIGYEWTSMIKGDNLHRVVVLRDGAETARKALPYTLADSADPEDLWAYLDRYQQDTGGQALAIPHNPNLSNGRMFVDVTLDGEAFDEDYARRRAHWEPLVEISQIKGDSEAHPFLSPNDEFADFESWDKSNLDLSAAKTQDMLKYEYVREALKRGLVLEQRLGVNPFQMGIIASTDAHTSLSTAEENNYFGKHPHLEPSPDRASAIYNRNEPATEIIGWEQVASGYAAVWAAENTREAIFDAMRRKEVYGTTGPRMTVRFFGGWDFSEEDAQVPDLARRGYRSGVPMGATLTESPQPGLAPGFLVAAERDPLGANLDRIQVVKGWLDKDGEMREKIYNVAWSDGRQLQPDGRLPPVGNTVNIEQASWHNSIGSPTLAAVWRDPDFRPEERAFYYLRVLQIPTPRWPDYDAAHYGTDIPEASPRVLQERAYTSPIWYRPG